MLPPSASLHSAFILPPSSSTFTLPSASFSPLSPVPAASSLSFNALYLRRKHQLAPLQPHRARARPLAFWQRQTEEREVAEEAEEMSDDEKEAIRLQKILDKRLVLAAQALQEDWPVYLFLIGVQAIPVLAGGLVGGNFLFFWLTACTCVYLGAKRSSAVARAGEIFQAVTTRNAFAAPIAASISLFGTYYLLKNQFDIATVYQLMTTFFGGYCLRDVLISTLLALGLGGSIQSFYAPPPKPIPARRGPFSSPAPPPPSPPASSSSFPPLRDPDEGELDGLKLAATLLSGGVCATYLWGPAAAVAAAGASGGASGAVFLGAISALLAANFITSGIALQAQASIPIKSLKPALIFLTGLFLYDIYFVFFSPGGVMESVATSLEGPVKLLSPRAAVRREGRRPTKEGITSPSPPRFQSRFSRLTAFFSPCPYPQSAHPSLPSSTRILPSPLGPPGCHSPRPVPLLHPGTRRHRGAGPLRRSSQADR
ncbi:minor histocompatibility antigen [Nannochloropsis gaditana]|uniref:Minor histocompatibility antigen n=1 Tax=Nannochloropsis gaditana TaxID=72520 RepID=W7TCD9_9STRA|nr:minor histocompatibility antigen [Nannochloropsis gaditana]EWM21214.1 minor histocompatibility antigen [Nannochloropsis gaditana]